MSLSAVHAGIYEAIHMKLEQFNKAAKRYSADAQLSLSTAQEKLSTYFGFQNYSALHGQLSGSLTPIKKSSSDIKNHVWCDLNKIEFLLLMHILKCKNRVGIVGDGVSWVKKGEELLSVVISFEHAAITGTELRKRASLQHMAKRFDNFYDESSDKDHDNWPEDMKRLASYLASLPGFDLTNREPRFRNGEQHQYRLATIVGIFDTLIFIEKKGGTKNLNVSVSMHDGKIKDRNGTTTLKDILSTMASLRRIPEHDEILLFTAAFTNLVAYEIYSDQ